MSLRLRLNLAILALTLAFTGALATLQVTWVYNEFFWATVLIQDFDKLPITSGLNNLRGQFFTDTNLVAAGSVLVALPVLIVFFILQVNFCCCATVFVGVVPVSMPELDSESESVSVSVSSSWSSSSSSSTTNPSSSKMSSL